MSVYRPCSKKRCNVRERRIGSDRTGGLGCDADGSHLRARILDSCGILYRMQHRPHPLRSYQDISSNLIHTDIDVITFRSIQDFVELIVAHDIHLEQHSGTCGPCHFVDSFHPFIARIHCHNQVVKVRHNLQNIAFGL